MWQAMRFVNRVRALGAVIKTSANARDLDQALVSISPLFALKLTRKNPQLHAVKSYKKFGNIVYRLDEDAKIAGTPRVFRKRSHLCFVLTSDLAEIGTSSSD
jgi:hypothetical protein